MVITTTAVGFLVLAIGLAICGTWFLRVFKRVGGINNDRKISFLLALTFLALGIQNGAMGLGSLFFAKDPEAVYYALLINHVLLLFAASIGVYTAYYIYSPKVSSKLPILSIVVLGVVAISMTIRDHPQPFITAENGIDLNMSTRLSWIIFLLLLVSIGSTFYIFARLYLRSSNKVVKELALVLSVLPALGIVNVFVRLVLANTNNANSRTNLFDKGLGIIGLGFIIYILTAPLARKLLRHLK